MFFFKLLLVFIKKERWVCRPTGPVFFLQALHVTFVFVNKLFSLILT
jgi:hypothetical protein